MGRGLKLRLVPIHMAEANAFVEQYHRHSEPVLGARFCVAVADDERVRGVAICGRPVARKMQDGWTLEVNRLATDGAENACSMLYAACWRAARAIGYTRLLTYTLESEGGASLRASNWKRVAELPARHGWDRPSRPRDESDYLSSPRVRWQHGESSDVPPPVFTLPADEETQLTIEMEAA